MPDKKPIPPPSPAPEPEVTITPEIERKLMSDFAADRGLGVENRDPNYEYYLASKDPQNAAAVHKLAQVGYTVVRQGEGETVPHFEGQPALDSLVQGDGMVLMKIPRNWYDYRQRKIREIGQERAAQLTETTLSEMERLGGEGVSIQGGSRVPRRKFSRNKVMSVGLDTASWSRESE